jgi:molecular chaperone GrpE
MRQDDDSLNEADSQQGNEPEPESEKAKQNDYDALLDRYARLQADFDNYRKRSQREQMEFIKFANEGLILELLGILDNFDRGIKAADQKKDFALLHQGVDMISRQLHALLEEKGLKRLKAVGEKFDPHRHEALEAVVDETRHADTVIEELQPGYLLNGRVIRPAKVKVSKKSESRPEEKEKTEKREEGNKEQE